MSGTSLPRGLVVAAIVLAGAGAASPRATIEREQPRPAAIAELWRDPGDIATRDVRHGEGGRRGVPPIQDEFEVVALDTGGYSGGYDVVDAAGRKWDVKTGLESQSEVVASRVLWAIGYHQPIVHFVPEWRIKGKGRAPSVGRFRFEGDHDNDGDWDWADNPFVGTREFRGLVVANLILNNWDIKTSNNRVYRMTSGAKPARRFVVQDVGASLGRTAWPVGSRSDPEGFESQRLVLGVEDGRVIFDYHARHKELLEDITPADVVWVCRLLDRLTDRQWADIFSAASYPSATGERFRGVIKAKIAEGLALERPAARRPS